MDDFHLEMEEAAAPAPAKAAKPRRTKRAVVRRPFTPLELDRAAALSGCRFTPGTFSKRFAREIAAISCGSEGITEKQAARLEALCWTYRRQLPARVVPPSKPILCWK